MQKYQIEKIHNINMCCKVTCSHMPFPFTFIYIYYIYTIDCIINWTNLQLFYRVGLKPLFFPYCDAPCCKSAAQAVLRVQLEQAVLSSATAIYFSVVDLAYANPGWWWIKRHIHFDETCPSILILICCYWWHWAISRHPWQDFQFQMSFWWHRK